METIIKDIRYGVRGLSKRPGFTAVAVFTLALGIGANSAIFSVLNAVLLRPLPYADADRIVRIDETEGKGGMGVSPPNLQDFQQQNHTFESIAGYTGGSFILTQAGEPLRIQSCAVSAALFPVLGVKPLIGRSFLTEDERGGQDRIALISYGLWQRRFGGDHAFLQKQITLDGQGYTVVGVMPDGFEFPIQPERVEVWTPLEQPEDLAQLRGAHYLDVVGRIKTGVSLDQAHADLEGVASRIAQQYPKEVSGKTTVVSLKEDLVGQAQPYLLMLAGAALIVLLIAIANVASLALARAAERQKEIALRTALGASKSRVVRQLLTESLILSFFGGLAGVTLAGWCTGFLVAIAPGDLPRLQSAHVDGRVLLFALAISVVSGALLGLIPALRSANPDLQTSLKEGETRSASAPRQALRKALVVSEVTLALVLLCGAGLLIKTLWKLNSVNPGFDPDKVLVAELVLPKTKYPDAGRQTIFFQQLIERIKASPGVESVGGTSNLPLSGTNMVFLASVEGRSFPSSFRSVSSDYFRTMHIPLLKGRWFDDHDTAESQPVVVINETMAHQIAPNYDEALGKRIKHGFKNQLAEVVGVIGDVKYAGLDQQTKPEMYAPFGQRAWPFMRLVVRAKSDPSVVTAAIRDAVRLIDKDQPVDKVTMMSSVVSASIVGRSFYMQLLGTFAALAFILAAVGIYGVVSYSVAQRTREIGIRVALGAQSRDVVGLVLKEALRLTLLGVGLGLVGAFAATRVLRNLLFEVKPTDPTTFICLSLLLTLVALLASYIPARRATKVDPLVALRYE
ncbi:MAG TPA: ABC transporter permease [Pyrinomonadaceae bacterium]|jgi:putative ABC transport system permease protein|nr:ABC transporter permease [Pyrinomonadaceae bacterium]